MRLVPLLATACLFAGCKKEQTGAPPVASAHAQVRTAEQDSLWRLAPDRTIFGLVISPRGLETLEHLVQSVETVFANMPELAQQAAEMKEEVRKLFPDGHVSLAGAGLTAAKGAAFFLLPDDGEVVIVPLADRATFLAVAHGTQGASGDIVNDLTCKSVQNVYACAKPAALLDHLGTSHLGEHVGLAGARGDIEVAAINLDADPGKGAKYVALVAQLGRGELVLRGAAEGMPARITSMFAGRGRQIPNPATVAGFASLDLRPILASFPIPAVPIVPGVTFADLGRNIAGPLTLTIPAGVLAFDLSVPMTDPAPARRLVEQCAAIPALAMLGAKVDQGVCRVVVPQLAIELDAWMHGTELRIGRKDVTAPGVALPPRATATELASGEWAFTVFGRGTLIGEGKLPPLPVNTLPDDAKMGIRALLMLDELGLGIDAEGDTLRFYLSLRTAWSNPDEVVAKLLAIDPELIIKGQAATTARQIANASPSAPFASDYKAGLGGMLLPVATLGMVAAVAIPAFMDYEKKSRKPEAPLQLARLGRNLEAIGHADGKLPKGTVALTPARSCCETGVKCDEPTAWQQPLWQELDFSLDAPHLFRYSYESDGRSFTAKAVADLDCDGIEITYVMKGTLDAQGNLSTTIVEPEPGTD